MSKVAIFDLDNCVSHDAWRIPKIRFELDNQLDEKWDAYHSLCAGDNPANEHMITHALDSGWKLAFITMRPEHVHDITTRWIRERLLKRDEPFFLFLRPESDHRSSVDLKRMYARRLLEEHQIVAAYDDRPDIVDMYRSLGITNAAVLKIHDIDPHTGRKAEPMPLAPPTRGEAPGCCANCGQTRDQHLPAGQCVAPGGTGWWHPSAFPFTTDPVAAFDKTTGGDATASDAEAYNRINGAGRCAADYLRDAADMYAKKNAEYGADYRHFGAVAAGLFPDGLTVHTAEEWNRLALFIWALSKMGRYAKNMSTGGHADSALDLSVYAAMLREMTT